MRNRGYTKTIIINNVTHVVNVRNGSSRNSHWTGSRHRERRQPDLFGSLCRGRSPGVIGYEAARTIGSGAVGFCRSAGGIGRNLSKAAGGMFGVAKGVVSLGAALFK